jgi:hypothetical protein
MILFSAALLLLAAVVVAVGELLLMQQASQQMVELAALAVVVLGTQVPQVMLEQAEQVIHHQQVPLKEMAVETQFFPVVAQGTVVGVAVLLKPVVLMAPVTAVMAQRLLFLDFLRRMLAVVAESCKMAPLLPVVTAVVAMAEQ